MQQKKKRPKCRENRLNKVTAGKKANLTSDISLWEWLQKIDRLPLRSNISQAPRL